MSTILYLDCASGISGDMVLGALIDLGVPVDELRAALATLVPAGTELRTARVLRSGISALSFSVVEPERIGAAHAHEGHPHAHDGANGREAAHRHGHEPAEGRSDASSGVHHHHHEESHGHGHGPTARPHKHRPLADIFAAIETSTLPSPVKTRAVSLYERIGRVEADIHGVPFDRVHLHEVGAIDSVVDIVGATYAFHWLGIDRVVASPLNVGAGRVRTDHGLLPVPAPATLQLLTGVPVFSDGTPLELVTPTGALLATGFVQEWGAMPAMTVARVGYGAGGRDVPGHPNVVRAVLGEALDRQAGDDVVVIETNIDDMNPQLFGPLMEGLLEAGALDVFYVPVQMKKNRPGTLVTVIAPPTRRDVLTSVLLRETSTIGVRVHPASRTCLARDVVTVSTTYGDVRVKVARDNTFAKAQPEFDDCLRLARAAGVSVRETYGAALLSAASLNRTSAAPATPRAKETNRD